MLHWFTHLVGTVFGLIGLGVTVVGGLFAFGFARQFVRERLRFVDGVRNPVVPWAAAVAVTIVLVPVVAILPIVGGGTALLIGAATGFGTASGVKALKRGE
ncbi:MAG TPA: hypothetical protein VHW65_01085 [Gemmatimonadales bacterium]|jgi:hypothetical protein|nr:hypothetical protein [Gemmatimonadales bacterium]